MKCPYCKEEIARFSSICGICGEKVPKIFSIADRAKEFISSPDTKKILKKIAITVGITAVVAALISVAVWGVRLSMMIAESNKFTDNGYKSIVKSDDYTYVSHYNIDFNLMTDKIVTLVHSIAIQEEDLMSFFKKSKSIEDNTKLFNIFMTNVDKYKQDAELVYNNSSATFEKLDIKISEPIKPAQYKPIAITKPEIKSFYLITEDTDSNGYVFFRYDYKYMSDNYAKYLTEDWKEYFALEVESDKDFKGVSYDSEKYIELAKVWSPKWTKFVEKYPNFLYTPELKEYAFELKSYSY